MHFDAAKGMERAREARRNELENGLRTDVVSMLAAFGIGLGAMYWLDPRAGRRRRAEARQRVRSAARSGAEAVRARALDVAHRAKGTAIEAKARLAGESVADQTLVERVRARIGRAAAHPRTIVVEASDGVVALSGKVEPQDIRRLLRTVSRVRGVKRVECRVEALA